MRLLFSQAEQIREQPVCAVGAGWQLAPQSEADIDPASFPVLCFDQRAGLAPRIQRKWIGEADEIDVPADRARQGSRCRAPAPSRPMSPAQCDLER